MPNESAGSGSGCGCLLVMIVGIPVAYILWQHSPTFGIIAVGALILIAFSVAAADSGPAKKDQCEICGNPIRATNYKWTIKGKEVQVCSQCNQQMEHRRSKQAIDQLSDDQRAMTAAKLPSVLPVAIAEDPGTLTAAEVPPVLPIASTEDPGTIIRRVMGKVLLVLGGIPCCICLGIVAFSAQPRLSFVIFCMSLAVVLVAVRILPVTDRYHQFFRTGLLCFALGALLIGLTTLPLLLPSALPRPRELPKPTPEERQKSAEQRRGTIGVSVR